MGTLLMIGTRKGLWIAESDDERASWKVRHADDEMSDVHSVAIDTRGEQPRLFASNRSFIWGTQLRRSDDLGETWQSTPNGEITFPEDTGASLEAVWSVAPSPTEPGVVWAGTEPSALFRSEDGGETFTLVRGLWDHPHRPQWHPGNGGQAIHTLLPHPDDPQRIAVAMSTGGVYLSEDGGDSWSASNSGIRADFMPEGEQYPEFGQCVHKVSRSPVDHDRMYLQNHGGVYRSDDGGAAWKPIDHDLPVDFGFPVVAHPRRKDTAYLFPLTATINRFPDHSACRVYRTQDAGESWEALGNGLPDQGFYSSVLRDAMCVDGHDPLGVYFGSRDGTIFASNDEGDSWHMVAEHLPDVLCVRAATID
jgi:photosystem II stability/assembly factor-like uncharacterized protein